jgi:hypothetical protein
MSSGKWATTCKKCGTRYKWEGAMSPAPACPKCTSVEIMPQLAAGQQQVKQSPSRGIKVPMAEATDSAMHALELCDEIESLAEDIPSAGEGFAASVCERTAAIRETVELTNYATDRQIEALENMIGGIVG